MDPYLIGYIAALALLAALALGIPIGVAMGVIGVGGMIIGVGTALTFGQLRTLPFAVVNNYDFAVLPLFVLMGVLAESSGITSQVFYAADLWLRRLRGGLYQAVVVGSAIFAAISGSTIVNAVVFTRIAYPEMVRYGYSRSLSIGCIASTGSFAAMIPPSITMVIYAIMTEQSVGRLLIAGVVPGIVTAIVYLIGIYVLVRFRPALAPEIPEVVSWRARWRAAGEIWPIVILIALVMGGIYSGLFPPSAAGAAGAFGAFCLAVWK
jgi:C4-dicarboxylate transporter, DctM subunit